MKPKDTVLCIAHGEVRMEQYVCVSNEARSVDRHAHEEYQFGVSSTASAAYRYRGAEHRVGPATFSVIDSGEPHDTYELEVIPVPVLYEITYVPPSVFNGIASEVCRRASGTPSFAQPVVTDARLLSLWHRYRSSIEQDGLERDERLLFLLCDLLQRFSRGGPTAFRPRRSDNAIRRVRDYLIDQHHVNIHLSDLVEIAGLSAAHLCVLFRRAFGVPPHRFQLQVRVDRAKPLLARGLPPAEVAFAVGFTHQSHFGRHFKRITGVTPSAYSSR